MKKGEKMSKEQKALRREATVRQHAEGRGVSIGFTDQQRKKARAKLWKGNGAGRVAIHRWVAYWKGKPKQCSSCGTTKARKFEWANKDHKYKRILEDYIRMCTSCHRIYDIKNNHYRQ